MEQSYIFCFLFFKIWKHIFFYFMQIGTFLVYIAVHHSWAWSLGMLDQGVRFRLPGMGVIDDSELPCGAGNRT